MNVIDVDLDEWDDNNDVFVEKQIKPINKLTVQQALLIKHNVLRTFESKSTSSTKTSKRRKTEKKENKNVCLEEKIQDFLSNENEVVHSTTINEVNNKVEFLSSAEEEKEVYCIKNTMQLCSHKKTNLIHHKRSTTPSKSVIVINQETNRLEVQKKQIITENVQLSPGIVKKKKKFSISEKVSPNLSLRSSPKKDFKKTFNSTFPSVPLPINDLKVTESTSFSCFSNFTDDSISGLSANETTSILESHFGNITQSTDEINFEDNGELLCLLLKKIILEVTKKQMNLKSVNLKNGKTIEKLLSDKECDILEEFCKLEGKICKVYVRMLCRTKQWHRVSKIYFKDVSADLYNVFEELHKKNFIDTNIEQENLQIQMEFLSRTEIQELCKLFRMPAKAYQSYKKTDLIKTLIKSNQSQTILTNMFSKKKDCLIDLLQAEVTKYLGTCIRINKAAKATFDKVILLFSFPHYFDEEDKRFRNQLYMCMNVHKQFINFPNYLVSQTIVFETREDFEKYSTALSIQESFHFAVISKDYKEFMSISEKVKEEFKNLLTNEE